MGNDARLAPGQPAGRRGKETRSPSIKITISVPFIEEKKPPYIHHQHLHNTSTLLSINQTNPSSSHYHSFIMKFSAVALFAAAAAAQTVYEVSDFSAACVEHSVQCL